MELKKFSILPAAIALSLAFAPVAFAGPDHGKGQPDTGKVPTPPAPPSPPNKVPTPTPPRGGNGGGSSSNDPSIACRIGNRLVYTANFRQCKQLKYSLGFGHGGGHGGGSVVVGGGHGYAYGGGQFEGEGYGYYQQQRVIRYVARPSRAAQMQMEKRARKAARRAAAADGFGYGDGAMVGYGNGVMVGGYGNSVVINGNVYAGQQVVRKKRKGKKARRVYVQQPQYGYEYDGSDMMKGGGF